MLGWTGLFLLLDSSASVCAYSLVIHLSSLISEEVACMYVDWIEFFFCVCYLVVYLSIYLSSLVSEEEGEEEGEERGGEEEVLEKGKDKKDKKEDKRHTDTRY